MALSTIGFSVLHNSLLDLIRFVNHHLIFEQELQVRKNLWQYWQVREIHTHQVERNASLLHINLIKNWDFRVSLAKVGQDYTTLCPAPVEHMDADETEKENPLMFHGPKSRGWEEMRAYKMKT
uniref:Uncharacterized protein n=1 Tax=Oryza rufipogon TaxID=4529 RepID=A0A0E0MTJ1_ORYRU